MKRKIESYDPENLGCQLCVNISGEEEPKCHESYRAHCLTIDRALLITQAAFFTSRTRWFANLFPKAEKVLLELAQSNRGSGETPT